MLNSTEAEEKYFIDKLKDENIHKTTFTTNTAERYLLNDNRLFHTVLYSREDVYLSGGIQFITTRILIVDMLKNRIPVDKITGFIILRAHKIIESCQEAFALRLFRQKNKVYLFL